MVVKQLSRIGIPLAMCTQHPDSASKCVDASEEVQEAVKDITPFEQGGFNCDEKMIDYEGKLTPYHQVKWVAGELARLGFKAGIDFILTPRLPNPRLEQLDRHLMVLIATLVVNLDVSKSVQYVINPMTGSTKELLDLQRRIWNMTRLLEEETGKKIDTEVRVIPLIEDLDAMLNINELLRKWIVESSIFVHSDIVRVMIGKSDTAMIYGHIPSVLGLKIALSKLWKLGKELGVRIYPILGVGKLPFRGNLSPDTVIEFADTYKWFYTVTIQSGIRYDMGPQAVREVIDKLQDRVGRTPRVYTLEEEYLIRKVCKIFTAEYLKFIVQVAEKILLINNFIPKRRERLEVAKYSRDIVDGALFSEDKDLICYVEEHKIILPRAINFVAALYTMGIPPTIIGLGRALRRIEQTFPEYVSELVIKETMPILRKDLEFDLALLDLELARKYLGPKLYRLIQEDLEEIKNRLNIESNEGEWSERHRLLIRLFYENIGKEEGMKYLVEAGIVRGSLG